jgi:wobble nucleotide-excising tRNase
MLLRRINEIKNVGLFINTRADFELTPHVLIFGRNGHGKSTLSAMFRSIEKNDPTVLANKKTLNAGGGQSCKLAVSEEVDGSMSNLNFDGSSWKGLSLPSVAVFDSRYVAENVYSDFTISHEQKSCISRIILGIEGVAIAERIISLKKILTEKKQKHNQISEILKGRMPDDQQILLTDFLSIEEDEKNLIEEKGDLERRLKVYDQSEKIQHLTEADKLSVQNISRLLFELAAKLHSTLPGVSIELTKRLERRSMELCGVGNARDWLRKGTEYLSLDSANCPFCLQSRSGAESLFSDYEAFFSTAYRNFVSEINLNCKQLSDQLNIAFNVVSRIPDGINVNTGRLKAMEDYIKQDDFQELENRFEEAVSELKNFVVILLEHNTRIFGEIKGRITDKLSSPLEVIVLPETLLKVCKECYDDLSEKLSTYNIVVDEINSVLEVLKKEKFDLSTKVMVEDSLKRITLLEVRFSIRTIGLIDKLIEYEKDIQANETKIDVEEKALEEHNNRIIGGYLRRVNELLEGFCANFKINIPDGLQRRGRAPVLDFSYEVRGTSVPSTRFGDVFSDSEKRLLAFCFFITQVEQMESIENTIVIIDDPFSSFDDENMKRLVGLVGEIAQLSKQTIVLSHYSAPLLVFLEETPQQWKQIRLETNPSEGSSFVQTDFRESFKQPHAKRLDKLADVLEGGVAEEYVSLLMQDARLVLEQEIIMRHRQPLKILTDRGVREIGTLINELERLIEDGGQLFKVGNIFSDQKAVIAKLRTINIKTRQQHHADPEGVRPTPSPGDAQQTVKELFDLVYEGL